MKITKWTYEAELDYILELENGTWVMGFLNEEGASYECPHTTDPKLIKRLWELEEQGLAKRLMVTVQINQKLDANNKQHPILIDVKPSKQNQMA